MIGVIVAIFAAVFLAIVGFFFTEGTPLDRMVLAATLVTLVILVYTTVIAMESGNAATQIAAEQARANLYKSFMDEFDYPDFYPHIVNDPKEHATFMHLAQQLELIIDQNGGDPNWILWMRDWVRTPSFKKYWPTSKEYFQHQTQKVIESLF